jgi:hypothetical protein
MAEARTALAGAVAGIVVGPRETVVSTGQTSTVLGHVTVTNQGEIERELSEALGRKAAALA